MIIHDKSKMPLRDLRMELKICRGSESGRVARTIEDVGRYNHREQAQEDGEPWHGSSPHSPLLPRRAHSYTEKLVWPDMDHEDKDGVGFYASCFTPR